MTMPKLAMLLTKQWLILVLHFLEWQPAPSVRQLKPRQAPIMSAHVSVAAPPKNTTTRLWVHASPALMNAQLAGEQVNTSASAACLASFIHMKGTLVLSGWGAEMASGILLRTVMTAT